MQLYIDAWKLGIKAIAIYRDNCKVAQPLSGKKDDAAATRAAAVGAGRAGRRLAAAAPPARRPRRGRPQVPRRRLRGLHPRRPLRGRHARRHLRRHRQGGHDPRRPDELVHDRRLAGPAVRRAARGVRLEVRATCASSRAARRTTPTSASPKSIVDYIFRWMGKKFLTVDQQEEIGILSPEVRARLAAGYANGGTTARAAVASPSRAEPPRRARPRSSTRGRTRSSAPRCGGRMVRTGSCYTCRDCGTNTGCS